MRADWRGVCLDRAVQPFSLFMPFLRSFLRAAILWVGFSLLLTAGAAPAQISATYEEPDLTTPVFDLNRLGLDAPSRSRLASVLAAGLTYYNATLDAKILGVALRLDPANRDALAAAERRRKNELPDPRAGNVTVYPTATVVSYLVGQSGGLRARGGADNGALAGCLSDIAADLAPDNANARYEKSACARLNFVPAWAFLRHQPGPGSEALPLFKRQVRISGLSVVDLPHGGRTGKVLEIIVTATEARGQQEAGVFTAVPVGDTMRDALQEAWRAVKLRHPGTGVNQRLILNFADNSRRKDGPSAGAAFTLALYTLYDALRLADDAAMTGAIAVDGRVRPVGGVPWKIRAAQVAGRQVVAIPRENARDVDDMPFLFPANTMWKVQIIAVDTLDEALAVMRADRPANVQAALDLFATIQRRLGEGTERLGAAQVDLAPTLREVLRLYPGHASAAAMLRTLEGRTLGTLSVYTSLDELNRFTESTLDELHDKGTLNNTDAQGLMAAAAGLDALRPRLDFRTVDLCNARAAFMRAAAAFVGGRATAQRTALAAELSRCVDVADEVEGRMASDPALAEALRH